MFGFLAALVVFIAILTLLLFTNINVYFYVYALAGVVRQTTKIKVLFGISVYNSNKEKLKAGNAKKNNQKQKRKKLFRKFYKQKGIIKILRILKKIVAKTNFKQLDAVINIGTNDAGQTALVYGICNATIRPIVWAVLPDEKKYLINNFKINPNFNGPIFDASINCIISIKIVHIIYIILSSRKEK